MSGAQESVGTHQKHLKSREPERGKFQNIKFSSSLFSLNLPFPYIVLLDSCLIVLLACIELLACIVLLVLIACIVKPVLLALCFWHWKNESIS